MDEQDAHTQGTPGPPRAAFPIIGIGASAGGLSAFEAFFSAIPPEMASGMAIVLVQHLAPDHASLLVELISRYTPMRVCEVEEGMTIAPGGAYIIPPNRDMTLAGGTFHLLVPAATRERRMTIDHFFRSLAQDQKARAICIVLSGTGNDGSAGIRAVKGEGGLVLAQHPESAEHDGMPQSAIGTGLVDYVLPPGEMPAQLLACTGRAPGLPFHSPAPPTPAAEGSLKRIFLLLRAHTGHDFSEYKRTTILRRIERRMAVHQVDQMDAYTRLLQQVPDELDALFHDLLIGVTSFFRDPTAFEALEASVIPQLLTEHQDAPIRVWVPGCSTGEEAYSIAIAIQAHLDASKPGTTVQIFATDIDPRAIEIARSGVYPSTIAQDIPPARLTRYFSLEPGETAWRIHKHIRELLVFSVHDLNRDPPFSRLDLISCRNLMIYLEKERQERLLPMFHYALRPGGTLFLGTSETVGDNLDLFSCMDRKARIFQRRPDVPGTLHPPRSGFLPRSSEAKDMRRQSAKVHGGSASALRERMERALLLRYAPPAVLVDERGDIVYLHGRTGQYLEPAPGEAGLNILKMAREGLRRPLVHALHQAVVSREEVRLPRLNVKTNGEFSTVDLIILPMSLESQGAPTPALYLVTLQDVPRFPRPEASSPETPPPPQEDPAKDGVSTPEARIAALTRELRAQDEVLKASNEELETTNEDLKSANEELQSVNEEMQSANEELETSKEELQSVNEELATVNAELQQKVAGLSRANNDLANLLAATEIGTIFVDHDLRIQRFTPAVTSVIHLIPTDVGRPVGHIVTNLMGYGQLITDIRMVLDTLVPRDVEVQSQEGAWYLLRIRPYRTLENVIEGAVVTFTDITTMKAAQAALRESEVLRRLSAVVRDARDAIVLHDLEGRTLAWNPAARSIYGWTEDEAMKLRFEDRDPPEGRPDALDLVRRLASGEKLAPCRTQRLAKDDRIVKVWLTATALVDPSGSIYGFSTHEREVELP